MRNQSKTEDRELSVAEIVALFEAGDLGAELHRYHDRNESKSIEFTQRLVTLHNSDKIDLFEITKQSSFSELKGPQFFRVLRLYCDIIPKLKGLSMRLMECCSLLAKMAGGDGASVNPSFAFLEWCKTNHSEALSVVNEAKAENTLAIQFAGFALQALADRKLALTFLDSTNVDIQRAGIMALSGRITCDQQLAREAIVTITAIIANSRIDDLRARALSAVFDLIAHNACADLVPEAMTAVAREPGPWSVHSVSDLLWQKTNLFNLETLDIALGIVLEVDKKNHMTVEALDMGLAALIRSAFGEKVAEFLALLFGKAELSFSSFENTASEFRIGNSDLLYSLIGRWLTSGNIDLCRNVGILLGEAQIFQQSVATLALSPMRQRLFCGKVIGFLLFKPVTCSSLLVSILRGCDEQLARFTSELLGGFILTNFGNDVKTYLKSIDASCPSIPWVSKALKINEDLIHWINTVAPIRELYPSASQQNTASWHWHESIRTAQEEAEADSWITHFFPRSTVLYGHRLIAPIIEADGLSNLQTVDLQEFTIEFEKPRLELLDPISLYLTIWRFQTERLS